MNPISLPSSFWYIVGQIGLFNLGMTTGLGEKKETLNWNLLNPAKKLPIFHIFPMRKSKYMHFHYM